MPPEPLPWDRKELRKHESGGGVGNGGGGGGGFGGPRWREPPFPHHPYNNHHHHNNHHGGGSRWFPDFRYRPPPGHGKQGGRHLYLDDLGHGFNTPRPNDKMVDDESCRPSWSGRYGRSSRENRGSFVQKDWKGYSSEISSLSNGPGRPSNMNEQRPLDNVQHNSSVPSSDLSSRDQSQIKDQHDIGSSIGAVGSTGQKLERENSVNSIEWQPLKWTRSGSLSSRGSGFSHSSSAKNMVPESEETKVKLIMKNVKSASLADVDAAACVSSLVPSEETNSQKKPRLGWGEGLAKYEKKKVEVADDSTIKNGPTVSGNSEPVQCHFSNFTEKSRALGFSDCASPATPSSVACSSSPGVEEKLLVKTGDVDHDNVNLCSSPSVLSQNHCTGSTFKLENLDLTSLSRLNLSINELLQSDDPCTLDSGFVRSSAMNKLLLWKNDISKVLEATESEIDLLETELKSLISEPESNYPCLDASSSVPAECDSKPCEDHSASSTIRPTALQLVPAGCMLVEDAENAPNNDYVALKDEDVDSPGSATSKFVHVSSMGKDVFPPHVLKDAESFMDPVGDNSGNLEVECSMDDLNEKKVASSFATTSGDDSFQAGREEISFAPILASNRDHANGVSEVFNKLLLKREYRFDISIRDIVSQLESDSVKKRFLRKKFFQRLKEKMITLKFKMFQHTWKEEARLSLKKLRAKSHKRSDFSLRIVNKGCQKHRSSIRSRYSFTAASLSIEPTTEIVNYARKLLSEPQAKAFRSVLKMPAMILDKQERMASRFISTNGLVEDPCAVEKERSIINPWTSEEKKVFLEKLTTFGKDFRKIASFLDHKTTADCVEFYYKNHKSDSFEKTKKPDFAKQAKSYAANTYLVASGKRWSREANAVSLDLLGAASAIVSSVDGVKIEQNYTSKSFFAVSNSYRTPRVFDGLLERSNSLDLYNDERETVAADVLAGICGSLSSEAMSSCITSSVDPGESYQEWKYQKVGYSTRRPLTPEVTQNVDDETCSDESCGEMDPTDWTDEEKFLFIQAVSTCGRDFAMISRYVRTRSRDQCKVFFGKARKCLGLDLICPAPGNLRIDDGNGGGSDTEDACTVETGSLICSEKLGSKTELEIASSHIKLKHEPVDVVITNMKSDLNKMEEDNEAGGMDSADTLLMSKNLVPDDCQMEAKPEVDSDGIRDGAFEVAQGVRGANHHNLSDGQCNEIRSGDVNASYLENPKAKFEGPELLLHESNSSVVKVGTCLSDKNGVSCSLQDKQSEAHLVRNDSLCIANRISSGLQPKTDLELDSTQKPHDVALRKSDCSFPFDVGPNLSCKTKHGKPSDNDDFSVLDSEEISDNHRANSSSTNEQHISGNSAVEHLESSHILNGYPVPVSTMKEMTGDISCKKVITFQGGGQSDWISFGRRAVRDSFLQKCNSSKPVSSGAEISLPSLEQSRGCSGSTGSSYGDKPCSNGNVKLFGQILSKPSPHKPSSSAQQNEDNSTRLHCAGSKSSKVKSSSCQMVDGPSAPTRYAHNNFGGSEKRAQSSFEFWDWNRIQNGLSSTSESALLLAKYPSAFGSYAMASTKIDQRPLHGVGKNGECSLNSVSVFPTRDIGDSNGLADFQVYGDHEVQPFSIDARQQHDILLSEMQRRNGLDVVSGMQQQPNGLVGINIVGRGGVLVGGQCTTVSDPVTAIRMQYAKAEQFSGQTGNTIREDDSWRGKANIGR